jgi:hypothetical protein
LCLGVGVGVSLCVCVCTNLLTFNIPSIFRSDRSPAVPRNAMPQALRVAGEFLRLKNSPPNEIPNRLQLKQPEIRVQEQPMQENDAQGEQEDERQKRQGCKQTKQTNRGLVHKLGNIFGRRR